MPDSARSANADDVANATAIPMKPVPASAGGVAISVDDGSSQHTGDEKLIKDGKDGDKDGKEGEKKEEEKEKGGLSDFGRILMQGDTSDRILQVVATFTSIASGAALPFMTVIFGKLLTKMTEGLKGGTLEDPAQFQKTINDLTLYFVYLFAAKFVVGFIGAAAFRISATRISARIRLRYMKALFRQDLSYLDTVGAGEVAVRITTNSNLIQAGISEKFNQLWMAIAMALTAGIIAFVYNWELTLITLTMLPGIAIIYTITIPIVIKKENKLKEAYEKAATLAQEIIATMRTVKAFNAEEKLTVKYGKFLTTAKKMGYDKIPLMAIQYASGFALMWAATAFCFWYGTRMLARGKIGEPGDVFVVLFCATMFTMSWGMTAMPITAITVACTASRKMFEVIDREPLMKEGLDDEGLKPDGIRVHLAFKDVTFSYPGKRKNVTILNRLSLEFEEGKNTAIVGPSGSGKSTIVSLLERWYDPDVLEGGEQGTVSVDGTDLKQLNISWWRSQIGLVQQEPFLFNDTVLKNVAHGLLRTGTFLESEEKTLELVKEACREANAAEFIERLPEGYNTRVGEGGIKLSGGQKQRIAIARSIISQPSILILDEATSALDPKSETIVQQCLDRLSKTRTTITIAHRLSTIKKADKIIVLGKGEVVESGTHEELMQLEDGQYRSLVAGQNLGLGSDTGNTEKKLDEAHDSDLKAAAEVTSDDEAVAVSADKGKKKEEQKNLGVIRSIYQVFWESNNLWPVYLLSLAASMLAGACMPMQAFLFASFINNFTNLDDIPLFLKNGNFWAMTFAFLALAVGISYAVLGYTFTKLQYYLTTKYRREYFGSILRQPIPFFDQDGSSSGTLSARLDSDPTAIQEMMGMNFGMLLVALFSVLGCIIISLCFGWKLALVGTFAAMPFVLFAGVLRVYLELYSDSLRTKIFADSAQFAAEAVAAFRTVSSLTMEKTITTRYEDLLRSQVHRDFGKAMTSMGLLSFSESVVFLAMALVFWYGTKLIATEGYTATAFFVIEVALINGAEQAGAFFAHSPNLAASAASSNRIFNIRETDEEKAKEAALKEMEWQEQESSKGKLEETDALTLGCSVELRDVSFTYPGRDRSVIHHLNLRIEAGQFVAFVGASGCGKSTLISLLMGFYPLTSGQILVNGIDISTVKLPSYRKKVSLVAQEPVLYQGSIASNVRLGIPSSPSSSEKEKDLDEDLTSTALEPVKRACALASISTFIESLPSAYATDIGTSGLGISGGQKQRLALARALIRSPRLLLLDEATSSLDSHSEREVLQALEGLRGKEGRNVTMIAVAHRLATVRDADCIFVLEEGRVAENGTHEELIAKKGQYYEMCLAQALDK